MVDQSLPDPGEVGDDVDPQRRERRRRSDAGAHQDQRRPVRSGCEHDLCGVDRLGGLRNPDSDGPSPAALDPVHQQIRADGQIRAASRLGQVRQRGAHPHAVEGRERDHAGADRPGAVVICDLRITDRGSRRQRRGVRGPDLVASVTTYRERPAATMPVLFGVVEVALGRLERGQHLVERPAGVAERHPRVVVGRRPPQGECGVRRRAAADEASPGELDRSTRRVRLARQPPVVASGGHPRVCDIRREVVARRVVGARLEQQHAALARFAESCCQHAPG